MRPVINRIVLYPIAYTVIILRKIYLFFLKKYFPFNLLLKSREKIGFYAKTSPKTYFEYEHNSHYEKVTNVGVKVDVPIPKLKGNLV